VSSDVSADVSSFVSERDVVFTPFMLRVRDIATRTSDERVTLHFEASHATTIAVAVDEWFGLRARAEHVIAEANAMLEQDGDRIQLDDECGTGELAFVLRSSRRSYRFAVHVDAAARRARLAVENSALRGGLKPVDLAFLEDLAASLLSPHPAGADVTPSH
jgi:hypothetical protein